MVLTRIATAFSCTLIACVSLAPAGATNAKVSRPGQYSGYSHALYDGHQLSSHYVAMRDGTRLAVDIYRPTLGGNVVEQKLPVLWMHTPYNRRNYRNGLTAETYPGKALLLAKYGYVVAVADFRGLFASFGRNAGYNRGEWQDAARMDAYDMTEWLAKQSWSDGKVGMWGCSATGGSQMQAMTTAPPSLKAVFPMSCEWDVYDFVSPGGISPPSGVPTQIMRGGAREQRDKLAIAVDGDTDRKLLDAAIAEHAQNVETAGYTPFRDSTAENFSHQWWLKSSPHSYAQTIDQSRIAVYLAGNWDEGGTRHGVPFSFNNIKNPRKMIFGPATHCDWTTVQKETGFDIIVEEHRFFDHWLKGVDNGVMKEDPVTYYTYHEIRGKEWKTAKSWPLPNEQRSEFYLDTEALLRTQPARGKQTSAIVDFTINEQTFWDKGVKFVTEPLTADTEVTGHPVLKLWVATSATDIDLVARIDDVAPDGKHEYHFVEGKLRASLRQLGKAPYNTLGLPWHPYTSSSAQLLTPNEPVVVTFDLYPISYVFRKGHRIRLTLNFADERATSKIDPAPQVTVHHSKERMSVLTLPLIARQ
jgi:predicted acyl esterase